MLIKYMLKKRRECSIINFAIFGITKEMEIRMKKIIATCIAAAAAASFIIACSADGTDDYSWAAAAVDYCVRNNIMTGDEYGNLMLGDNLTRAQMARMLTDGFGLPAKPVSDFLDMSPDNWSYGYSAAIGDFMPKKGLYFNPEEYVTREEFTATLVRASGLNVDSVRNPGITAENFSDANKIGSDYKTLIDIAVERAYLAGSDGMIRPKDFMTRAEVCTIVRKVLEVTKGNMTLSWSDLGVRKSSTPMLGAAQITVDQACAWARDRGAADIFINAAPIYWQYGELFGIRPEIMYAQAAKETAFGNYGGAVLPEMNNWAGIKIKDPLGDRTEDHEAFATPEDGIRAHYNHMAAYVGIAPIGEPHDRYYVVKNLSWAGTVKTLEELGGKWCPDLYYGYDTLHGFLEGMYNY